MEPDNDLYRIEQKGSNYFLHLDPNTKAIKIPSQMYPLSGTSCFICSRNTTPFPDDERTEKIREVFDSIQPKVGYCYENIDRLMTKLKAINVDAQPYAGWEIVGGGLPVHHCFAVVDDHILDYNIRPEVFLTDKYEEQGNGYGDARKMVAQDVARIMHAHRPSEVMGFGRASDWCVYIASPCSPSAALARYRALIKTFPKHPSFSGAGRNGGINLTQELICRELERINEKE